MRITLGCHCSLGTTVFGLMFGHTQARALHLSSTQHLHWKFTCNDGADVARLLLEWSGGPGNHALTKMVGYLLKWLASTGLRWRHIKSVDLLGPQDRSAATLWMCGNPRRRRNTTIPRGSPSWHPGKTNSLSSWTYFLRKKMVENGKCSNFGQPTRSEVRRRKCSA